MLPAPGSALQLFGVSVAFVVGVVLWPGRDRLSLNIAGVTGLVLLASILKPLGGLAFEGALTLAIAYGTFWLACVPRGILMHYNRLGDCSCRMYIQAFPLQGWAVRAFGTQTPLQNMLDAFHVTLVFAVLSWHLIEGPAMRLRSRQRKVSAAAR